MGSNIVKTLTLALSKQSESPQSPSDVVYVFLLTALYCKTFVLMQETWAWITHAEHLQYVLQRDLWENICSVYYLNFWRSLMKHYLK